MKAELEKLIALQNADTRLRQLQADLDSIPQRRAEIEKEFDERAFNFKAIETRRDAARQSRTQLDKELAETRARAEKAERDLMASTNSKAYEAALREADAAKKHINELETKILEQMEAADVAEREIGEHEPEVARLRAESDERLREFTERTGAWSQELESLRAERERLLASLPKNLNALYKRISTRIRDGVAVAEARNGSCSACFIKLRPQMMAEVRRGEEIILCDNCNRILFYLPSEQATKTTSISAT